MSETKRRGENRKLTAEERRFVQEVCRTDDGKPASVTEAYRRAYAIDVPSKRDSTYAARVGKRAAVRAHIQIETARIETALRRKSVGNITEVESQLWTIAKCDETSQRDKISALREIARISSKNDAKPLTPLGREELINRIKLTLGEVLGSPYAAEVSTPLGADASSAPGGLPRGEEASPPASHDQGPIDVPCSESNISNSEPLDSCSRSNPSSSEPSGVTDAVFKEAPHDKLSA